MSFNKIYSNSVPTIKKAFIFFICSRNTYHFYKLGQKKFFQSSLEENFVSILLHFSWS
jgi:hypothetical protein